jgi:hypothetical protein
MSESLDQGFIASHAEHMSIVELSRAMGFYQILTRQEGARVSVETFFRAADAEDRLYRMRQDYGRDGWKLLNLTRL